MMALCCRKNPYPILLVIVVIGMLSGCGRSGPTVSQQTAPDSDQMSAGGTFSGQLDDARGLIDQAGQHLVDGQWDEAIAKTTQVLRHDWPNTGDQSVIRSLKADVYLLRGEAFLKKQAADIAVLDFNDALKYGDADVKAEAYLQRAHCQLQMGLVSRAIVDANKSIRMQPANREAWDFREDLLQSRQTERTVTLFASLSAAQLELQNGNADKARSILQREMLEKTDIADEELAGAFGLLARAQYQLEEYYRTEIASTRALRLDPQYSDALRTRGLSWMKRGYPDKAIADLQSAIEINPALETELGPWLIEARQQGGMNPETRRAALARIRQLVVDEEPATAAPGANEQWLLDLFAMPNSSDQTSHFDSLVADNPEASLESLNWLTDYLMLDRSTPGVRVLRSYLVRESEDVTPLEKRLWQAVQTRSAAASQGVNLFPDLAAYAIEYEFPEMLRTCIDSGLCRLKSSHMYQLIEKSDTQRLKFALSKSRLPKLEVAGLLRHCVDHDHRDQAVLIINQYPKNLTGPLVDFLGLGNQTASVHVILQDNVQR